VSFTLAAPEDFSLAASAEFAEGFPGTGTGAASPEQLSFAWALDGDWRTVHVVLSQHGRQIRGDIGGLPARELTDKARRDVSRILSLNVDSKGFSQLGRQDRVVAGLQNRFPGLRPVLFYTPYEAAAWSIIGQRIQMRQAAIIKQRLADEYGEQGAFPAPARLAELPEQQRGLTERKVDQLHQLAGAAQDGRLDRDRLRAMTYQDANDDLQRLPGIGPFSADLILARGMGAPDALPHSEKRLQAAARDAYGLPSDADIDGVAEGWRPYRSWVALLLRASAG